MVKTAKIIEGRVKRDIYGSYSDCSPGLYIDDDLVESILSEYTDQHIRITIEPITEDRD